jgi:hypothetical protein
MILCVFQIQHDNSHASDPQYKSIDILFFMMCETIFQEGKSYSFMQHKGAYNVHKPKASNTESCVQFVLWLLIGGPHQEAAIRVRARE